MRNRAAHDQSRKGGVGSPPRCNRSRSPNPLDITVSGRVEDLVARIRRTARAVLEAEGIRQAVLDIAVVGEARMRREHRRWLGEEDPTDVLAFDLGGSVEVVGAAREGFQGGTRRLRADRPRSRRPRRTAAASVAPRSSALDGQVIVCSSVARRTARARGSDWQKELLLYVVHGCLHLCGYDDEQPEAAARMHQREDEHLSALGLGAVYSGGRTRRGRAKAVLRGGRR